MKVEVLNIVDAILFHARQIPAAAAICAPGTQFNIVSYGRLERFIYNIGRNVLARGLQRGSVVAILVADQVLHSALILGLMRLGIVTLSARDANFPNGLRIDAVLTDAPHAFGSTGNVIVADATWTVGDGQPVADPQGHRTHGNDICRIILTSGTTGDAKAVAFTHDTVLARILRHNIVFGNRLPDGARTFSILGLGSSLGFFFLIYTLTRGGAFFLRGADAGETMQALDFYKIENLVASPAGLAEFVDYYERTPGCPTNLAVVLTAGSLLSKSLSERVRSRLCPHLVSVYGTTETSMVATALSHAIAHIPGAVGYITPGVSVEIVDHSGNIMPAGKEGLVRIRSKFGVDRYLGDPAGSEEVFRDGWFYPGDVGALTADQLLIISGREKPILNVGGDKVNPERIERVLAEFPGIAQAGAFSILNSFGIEELCAAFVSPTRLDEAALRSHCQRHLPIEFVPLHFLAVPGIPRTDTGKVDRPRLATVVRAQ